MNVALVKLEIPPGVVRRGTVYEVQGRWYDSHLIRWNQGVMGPIGGWTQRTTSAMTGKARAGIAWRDDSSVRWMAWGTNSKLYAGTQSVVALSDITPAALVTGAADATAAGGYGSLDYGEGTYGTARVDATAIQEAAVWTLDTFGQYLVACLSDDGRIFQWQLNTAVAAAALGGSAPTANRGVVVTPERFCFALGAGGNKRLVQWGDQESLSTWTPSATNQAGSFELATQGQLMCGKRLRAVTLLFTDLDVHAATYIGLPYVYSIQRVGENCGIISRGAAAVADTRAFWMGKSGFFYSDGSQTLPLACDVYEAVFNDMNTTQASKIWAMPQAGKNEIWWGFPSAASSECDKIVVFNYLEGHWALHSLTRLAGVDRGIFNNPIMADSSGYLWDHETGYSYTGALTTDPYAESGPYELGEGDRIMRARRLIADEKTTADVTVSFKVRDWPNDSETTYGPYTPANPTSIRFSARQTRLVVTGEVATGWRWGSPRVDVIEGSKR